MDSSDLGPVRDRKRVAEKQATKDDGEEGPRGQFDAEEEPVGNTKASEEEIKGRRILRIKRPEGAGTATGLFAGIGAGAPSSVAAPALATRGFGTAAASAAVPPPNPFAKSTPPPSGAPKTAVSPTSLNAKPDAGGIPSVFGANSTFKFSFTAPPTAAAPAAPVTTPVAAPQPQLQQQESAEDPHTRTLCTEPLKLHHHANGEWVDRGDVTVKVVVNTTPGAKPWAAVAAYAAKTKRQVLMAPLGGAFKLGTRADRQVTFVCIEAGGDGKAGVFVLRSAKDADARITAFVDAIAAAEKELAAGSQ